MKCPECKLENPEGNSYCGECGAKLEIVCPGCNSYNPPEFKFCGECGCELSLSKKSHQIAIEAKAPSMGVGTEKDRISDISFDGERKHVTILFSDMSGYTAMSERLDPEEVKEITSRIFGEIAQIVAKYEGFVEKFIGDAVMAIFGATKAYEDDPVRTIKAAVEIHKLVEQLSPRYEDRVGESLSMHTGINTGLVVTGKVDLNKGTHGISGDTINVAARLSSFCEKGDILVGPDTYTQAVGYFNFQALEPVQVKGKTKPINAYRVVSQKDHPRKIHRLQGVRAKLIGRKVEMEQLAEAVDSLRHGKGSTFVVCGTAGTGKSRLIEEFKATLDLTEIQWREGNAYPYAQNIPYFPLINLMNKAFQIDEADSPDIVRKKVENGIVYLIGEKREIIPFVGSLYSLSYPEIDDVSPEFWKSRLQAAIQLILSVMAKKGPTVICLEDLHWADPSFLELIRNIISDFRDPVLFLCIYRPIITLFTSHQISAMINPYHEILLQDLSPSESQVMIEALLDTKNTPPELQRFIHEKVQGNPFYLEEVTNSLIESKTLVPSSEGWEVTRPITDSDISSTIHGVIASRLDRLENETKRILQEASVIGRTFFYAILRRVTCLEKDIDACLSVLERLDLIKAKSLEPDLEYIFKHALTQDVVYNGLLKKERQTIHERIALVVEDLFHDRLPEFYETIAFHFKQGQSVVKAVDYLLKSGEKSLKRYAVDESHQYFKEAYRLISDGKNQTEQERKLIIDILIKWALVYYYRGDFRGLTDLLATNLKLGESLDDMKRLGMLYAWFGFALLCRNRIIESYNWLDKALQIGEISSDLKVIGYSCTWLSWTCSALGRLNEAIKFGERAQEISKLIKTDQYLYFKSLGGLGFAYYFKGDKDKVLKIGQKLVGFGKKHSNIRSEAIGHAWISNSYALDGNFSKAVKISEQSQKISADPFYIEFGRAFLGVKYVSNNQIDKAEKCFQQTFKFNREFGVELIEAVAQIFYGLVSITKGRMSYGLDMIKKGQLSCLENENMIIYCLSEYALGRIYFEIIRSSMPIRFLKILSNLGFIIRNVPVARKKAEFHYNIAIETAKEIGAKNVLGQAYLDLGLLHRAKRKTKKAQDCISEAIKAFEECQADVFLKQARDALSTL